MTIILLVVLPLTSPSSLKQSAHTDLVPRGIGNVMEAILEVLYNLTEGSAGAKWAKVIFPWFATIMIYVLFANLLKLIPGFESVGVLHPAMEKACGCTCSELAYLIAWKVEEGDISLLHSSAGSPWI